MGEAEPVNILLVDDQPAKLLTYREILSDLGENLIGASSAREALEQLLKQDIAVVLIDVCMPELDGFELARLVREHPRFQETAIIFVSGVMFDEQDRLRGYELGAVDYVSVPVVPEILRARVGVFIDLYRKTRQLEQVNEELERRVAERTSELEISTENLRLSEERLRLATDAGRFGTYDYDPVRNEVYWSPQLCELFGTAETAGSVDRWSQAIVPEDLPSHRAALARITDPSGPGAHAFEFRVRRPDGEVRWMLDRARTFFSGEGPGRRAVRLIGTVTDITDRKVEEARLLEADRQKDEFLALLGHELRNPLAPIRTAVELLGNEQVSLAQRRQLLQMIERQSAHLGRLVDDLVDVSRISSGRITLRSDVVELARVVDSAVEQNRSLIAERRHRLDVEIPAHPVLLRGDATRIAQILSNVLNNAAKYTPRGGVISLRAAEGERVTIRVRDNGTGVPPEMQSRVFDLFSRVPTDSDAPPGLGVGLALVKKLVELSGGSVRLESDGPGNGCEVTIELPRADTERVVADGAAPEPIRAGARRILVADDNQDSVVAIALLLEREGHEVRTATDGVAALAIASSFHPEVAVLDLGMPLLSGYDVARRLRSASPSIALIALTGWGQLEDRARSKEAGFDAHLVKPLGRAELFDTIAALTQKPASSP
jgi:PAS domain S-box-containing protein